MVIKDYKMKRARENPVCTPERIADILNKVRCGGSLYHSSFAAGTAHSTVMSWIKQGELDIENGDDTLHAEFVKRLRNIELEEIIECRAGIKEKENGHKGKQWTLERAYGKHYGADSALHEMQDRLEQLEKNLKSKKNAEKKED